MIKNGWYCCPNCGQKLFRVTKETKATALFVYCKHCKQEKKVNI